MAAQAAYGVKIKIKWTRKPAKEEGFYWLKLSKLRIIGQALDCDMEHWSLITTNGIKCWDQLILSGYIRSVEVIEEPE